MPYSTPRRRRRDVRPEDAAHRVERETQNVLPWPHQDFGHPVGRIEGRQAASRQVGGGFHQYGHLDTVVRGYWATTGPRTGPLQEFFTHSEAAWQTDDVRAVAGVDEEGLENGDIWYLHKTVGVDGSAWIGQRFGRQRG